MEPIKFEGSNRELQKPAGMTDKECAPLPVYVSDTHVISCWSATFWERLIFLFKGKLWLWVWTNSGTQPPVALDISDSPFVKESD